MAILFNFLVIDFQEERRSLISTAFSYVIVGTAAATLFLSENRNE
jgi:formate hydrogenlyase subunit 3/multisubunit Na+/H+ antiporter MnhD subunit